MSRVVRVLGTPAVSRVSHALTRSSLRSVAYHVVNDPEAFERQLDHLQSEGYRTVTARQVADAFHAGPPLPDRAIWITFDDGDVSVIEHALPLLRQRGMVATAFLCGAWIGSTEAPWWTVLEAAVASGLVRADDVSPADPDNLVSVRLALKRAPDPVRRRVLRALQDRLAETGASVPGRQWSASDVQSWISAGNDIGNHSWDHPVLDTCDSAEQRRQVTRAHDRLSELSGAAVDVFAWPNGDPSPEAAKVLRELGYRVVAICDHRLARRSGDPLALSRLRLDADAEIVRTRAILSGAHSAVFHAQRRFKRQESFPDVT